MKFILTAILASVCLLLPSGLAQSTTPTPATNKTDLFYNGTTSLLSLTRKLPMTVSVHLVQKKTDDDSIYLGDALSRVNFPEASKAKIEGFKTEGGDFTRFPLKLSNTGPIDGDYIAVTTLELNFEMIHNHKTGYWNLTSLDIALTGKMSSNCTGDKCDVNLKSSMNVAPKKGYTSNPVDVNCQRDYTLCAPENLCWTCYDQQIITANLTADKVGTYALAILIPGMKLQPLITNGTTNFGYVWDCDPIWSSSLWFSLLLSLFLIAILAWAIEMLVTLHTPSRFDDPKGKPLVVPLTE